MKLHEKIERAVPVLRSILHHHDAAIEDVEAAAVAIKAAVDRELDAAKKFRAERAKAAAAKIASAAKGA